jgi:hypothetical protein
MKPFPCLAVCASFLTCACNDRDDEGTTPYRSGVNASGPASTLGTADQQRLCQSLDAHVRVTLGYDTLALALCLPPAVLLGESTADCEQRLADCKGDLPPPAELEVRISDPQTCLASLRQCNLSVAALEGCVDVNLDWIHRLVEGVTCGSSNDARVRQMAASRDAVSACVNANAACQQWVEGGSSTLL